MYCTVNPGEQHVSVIISLNGGEGQNAQPAYKYRRLRKILTRYPALDAAMHNQKAECNAAEGPGQAEISLKQDHRVTETFFFSLMCLRNESNGTRDLSSDRSCFFYCQVEVVHFTK